MKYWAYVNNEILGPFEKEKLLELPSFSPSLLVCPQTPVGEKTEDWKEAATYPELSALLGAGMSGPRASAPPQAASFSPEPAHEPAPKPALSEPAAAPVTLKPLTASSIEPVPPADHKSGGVEISVNRLGKAHSEPEPVGAAQQATNDFNPLSLSQIGRRAENLSGQEEAPAAAPFEAPAPGFTAPALNSGGAPELETFARPSAFSAPAPAQAPAPEPAAAAQPVSNGLTRQDLSQAIDPLRLKLDQMGEVISSIKNQQFQRDIMDKLAYLENAVGEIKTSLKQGQPPAAQVSVAPAQVKEAPIKTMFGAQAPAKEEKPKEEPQPATKITDTGSKPSRVGPALKKAGRLVVTLALLAAVLLGAVVGLKNFGIFDATVFLPFPLPFVGQAQAPAPEPGAGEIPGAEAVPQPEAAPAAQEQQAPQPAEQAKQAPAPDISPEIIYFTRTYKATSGGPSLENKIAEISAAGGGYYDRVNWQVKQGLEGIFEIAAVIPGKKGELTYTFVVDYGKKTLLPADEGGKAAFNGLTNRPQARQKAPRAKKAAAAPRQKAQPRKAAAPKQAAAEDEYEYVYEDEDGTEQ
ncbi:MAG: hypothetical protein A2X35_12005 [Elusimicrobia bacterium GWA2_61_42]|nr:MAG: hypothetical protein A2X35_12005 [Elusimicrobia bacterium GWA2_61_42]OGR76371.1 MAG: hypothetical protein A2X38_01175 [Elusimicrobia bacterium GWC2_61_25]